MGGDGDVLQKLSGLESTCLGVLAGMGSKLINYPLLANKNFAQQGLPLTMNPSVVYRGLPVGLMNIGGTTGVQFFFTGFFQKVLCPQGEISSAQQSAAALMGGAVSGIPCAVWELTMIQQQRFGGSVVSVPQRIIKDHGLLSLNRGMMLTMARESIFTGAMLAMCPILQKEIVNRNPTVDPNIALAAGALTASLCGATLTHPVDTIKTCMQGDIAKEKYTSILQSGNYLKDQYGLAAGLFKGLSWRVALITTTFFLVNAFKQQLAPICFPDKAKQVKKQPE